MNAYLPLFTISFCSCLLLYHAYRDIRKYQLRRRIYIEPNFKARVTRRVEVDVSHLVKPVSLRNIDSNYQK